MDDDIRNARAAENSNPLLALIAQELRAMRKLLESESRPSPTKVIVEELLKQPYEPPKVERRYEKPGGGFLQCLRCCSYNIEPIKNVCLQCGGYAS